MPRFLQTLARNIVDRHGTELVDVAVVLPSKRAGQFLLKELVKIARPPFWSPRILTFNELMEQFAGMRTMDTTTALLEVHSIHKHLAGANAQPLAEVLQWAPTTLRDISEIESHLLDLDKTYVDLRSIGGIEDWSFANGELSTGQRSLQHTWEQNAALHKALRERATRSGMGVSGMVEHAAVQALERNGPLEHAMVHFAGLNALSPAQRKVIKTLLQRGKAALHWDADAYYLDRPEQEAGMFLRKNRADLGPGSIPPGNGLTQLERSIRVKSAPNAMAMAQHAAAMVSTLNPDEQEGTVVVLCDEGLLIPFLEALPEEFSQVNITMGLALGKLPAAGLLEQWYQVLLAMRPNEGHDRRLLLSLLNTTWLRASTDPVEHERLTEQLRRLPRMHVPWKQLEVMIDELSPALASALVRALRPTEQDDLFDRSLRFIGWLKEQTDPSPFVREQLFHLYRALERSKAHLALAGQQLDLRSFHHLWRRSLQQEKLDLFGEPLQGLQVMGLLETRSIDPERVVLLSANEGYLPANNVLNSFIPYDVRRVFGLPGRQDPDAIAAYNFFRILHHCQHLDLMYVDNGTGDGGGPSRFIDQLRMELCTLPGQQMSMDQLDVPIDQRTDLQTTVHNTEQVIERCRQRIEKGLSPSAIGTYLNCPLDFYFKYLLGLARSDIMTQGIAPDVLGTFVHEVLEKAYEHTVAADLMLDAVTMKAIISDLPDLFKQAVQQPALVHHNDGGAGLLTLRIAEQAVRRVLDRELQAVTDGDRIKVFGLEQDMSAVLATSMGINARFKGRIDRMEERNGEVVIIDHKSGSVAPSDLHVAVLELEEFRKKGKHRAMQLLIYAWMYLRQEPDLDHVHTRILPIRKPSTYPGLDLRIGKEKGVHREQLSEIDQLLEQLLNEMLDPERAWMHNADNEYCTFCPK